MHEDTGRICREDEIPEKEKKKYVPIVPAMVAALAAMEPDERVKQLALERNLKHWERARQRFFEQPSGADQSKHKSKRKAKRKAQKLARRRNRG